MMQRQPKSQDDIGKPIPETAITDPALAEEMAYTEKPYHELAATARQLGLEDEAIAQKAKAVLAGEEAGHNYLDSQQANLDEQRYRLHSEQMTEAKELLFGQLDIAHRGHVLTVNALNINKDKDDIVEPASPETLTSEFESWLTPQRLSYIIKQIEAGRVPHVVATRNVHVDGETLLQATKEFGKGQKEANIWPDVFSKHTKAELSGTNPSNNNQVYFNVFFEDTNRELRGSSKEISDGIAKLQAEDTFIEAPSMLKGLTYLFTLREARGGDLSGPYTEMHTYVLDPTIPDDSFYTPNLEVDNYGRFTAAGCPPASGTDGRALVG
jgi:hypothetical protein